jgi:hypothetical protein
MGLRQPCGDRAANSAGTHYRRRSHRLGSLDGGPGASLSYLDGFESETSLEVAQRQAGVDDFDVATAAYRAACLRWPTAKITLRQGARIVRKSWQ